MTFSLAIKDPKNHQEESMKPKFTAFSSTRNKSSRFLPALTLITFQAVSLLHAEVWNVVGNLSPTPNYTLYDWDNATNWTPNTIPNAIDATALFTGNILANGPGGPQLQGYHVVRLNVPTIVGNLTLGDSNTSSTGFNGNGFFEINAGTAGTLTFQASAGNASLQKTTSSGTTADFISANVILNSTLAADLRSGGISINGPISGVGSLIRSGSVGAVPTAAGGTLTVTNNANSYTGDTIIEHSTLSATLSTDILPSTNSVLGNSANAIVLGTSILNTNNQTAGITFTAGSDTGVYTVSRGIDVSQSTTTGACTLTLQGNAAGGVNSNKLTLAGPITFGSGAAASSNRNINFRAFRTGYIDITGNITQVSGLGGANFTIGTTPQDPNVDGSGAGTVRFSNLPRTFTASPNLLMGTAIVAGDVLASPTNNVPSPIGQATGGLNLTQGNSGNIVGGGNFVGIAPAARDTSVSTIRSIFMETPGTTYARAFTAGNASSTTPNFAVYGSAVSIPNGFQFGGINTTGTITFSGNITGGDMLVGATTSPNVITTGANIALMAEASAIAEFTGNILDSSSSATNARITINQFRNHPNIDAVNNSGGQINTSGTATATSGSDGIPDATANQLVGTAKTGTVLLSGANTFVGTAEVLGGTLQLGNAKALGWGGRQSTVTGTTTVTSGSVIDLNGITDFNEPIILNGTGIASGGALTNSSTNPASIVNGIAGIQIASTAGTGSAYSTPTPTITISGTGTGATATSSYGLTTASINTITGTATNYSVGDYVNVTGGNGNGATAKVTSVGVGGVITGLAIDQPGSGYTAAPTGFSANTRQLTTTSSGTTTLTGNATNFTVTGVTLTAAGSGYTGTPTYAFNSGSAVAGTLVLSSVTLASDSSIGGVGDIAISAVVGQSGGARSLTKVGAGALILSGANTYTGNTTLSTGVLQNDLPFLADGSDVSIGATGQLNLNFDESGGPVQDVVNKLFINGVGQTGGTTYGASGSGAAVIDNVHFAGPGVLFVTTTAVSPYTAWANTFLPADVSNPAGDNDNDGLVNQQEFAFGLNPTLGSSVNPIVVGLSTSGSFSYSRYAASGLAYKVFTSTDLTIWTERTGATQTPGAIDGNGVQTVVVTTLGASPVGGKLFVRVEAQ
jgi:autotransporter-associated beta strand protein